jgi:GTPase
VGLHYLSPLEDVGSSEEPTYFSPNRPLDDVRFTFEENDGTNHAAAVANEYSFFDEAIIVVRAGSGGQGSATYQKSKVGQDGLPDGGNGGRGGHVLLVTDRSLNTLAGLTTHNAGRVTTAASSGTARHKSFRAENGGDGGRMFQNGRFGQDVVIRVPPGTVVQEQILDDAGAVIRIIDVGTLIDGTDDERYDNESIGGSSLNKSTLLVARGGLGGEGSAAAGRHRGSSRRPREPPQGGQRKTLMLTLKIVADVALVGVPNAGKSTFLAAVTRYVDN